MALVFPLLGFVNDDITNFMKRVLRRLKHWFIPHPGNDHKPHVLRTGTAIFFIVLALVVEAGYWKEKTVILPRSKVLGVIINSVLVDETNENRSEADLNTLHVNPVLQAAAQAKANDMATKGYFAHVTPEGFSPWYWFDFYGYNYVYAGENLAVDFTDSKDVTDAWMRSPLHRANILNNHFTEIGIASARGVFQGHEAVFVVQLFGSPAITTAATPSTKPIAKANPIQIPSSSIATSTPVLGESTFVATAASTTPATTTVVGEAQPEIPSRSKSAFDLAANPRRAVDVFALLLLLIVFIALAFKVFNIGFTYPHLVVNGLMVVLVLVAIISLNHTVLANLQIF